MDIFSGKPSWVEDGAGIPVEGFTSGNNATKYYDKTISKNRGKPKKYSSSNRIGSLIGNGLLTFIDYKKRFNHFFNQNEIIFYHNKYDLSDKINFYKRNNNLAKKIAQKGQQKYFKLFKMGWYFLFIIHSF